MNEKVNLDWKKYETITKYIYETLGKEIGVIIEGYGNNCKVEGKSGVYHQIDVLTKHSDGIHNYRTAIECKYWKEKINKDIVMKVSDIIEDASINKGVIISKNGFTNDGISFAKYKNIGLVELREITEKDKEISGEIFDINTWILRPQILGIKIDALDKIENKEELIEVNKVKIQLINGNKIPLDYYLTTFKKDLQKGKVFQIITKGYRLKGASLINEKTNSIAKIKGIIITGVLTKMDSDLKFHPVDQIWLIMKSFFEDRTFTISEKGIIKESRK